MRMPRVVGPMFTEELHRLGRRPSLRYFRVAVALVMLLCVAAQYPVGRAALPIADQSRFGQSIFAAVAFVQFGAVLLVMPLFGAAVLTEEREKKTLELLLTTTLTGTEIVVGKFLARLAVVASVVGAGLPVVAIVQVFGGFDLPMFLQVEAMVAVNAFGVAGVAAGIAAKARSYRVALYLTWLVVGFSSCVPGCGPWVGLRDLDSQSSIEPWYFIAFLGVQLTVGGLGLFFAVRAVRPAERAPVVMTRAVERKAAPVPRRVVEDRETRQRGVKVDFSWDDPPGEAEGPTENQKLVGLLLAAVAVGVAVGLAWFESSKPDRRWVAAMAVGWIPAAMVVMIRSACGFAREREGDTLTILLTALPSRREILWRKSFAAVKGVRPLAILTAGTGAVIVFAAGPEWVAGFLAVGLAVLTAAAGVGAYLSVQNKTTFMAQLSSVPISMLLGLLPMWVGGSADDTAVAATIGVAWVVPGYLVVGVTGWYLAADDLNRIDER